MENFGSLSAEIRQKHSLTIYNITWILRNYHQISNRPETYESPHFFIDANNEKFEWSLELFYDDYGEGSDDQDMTEYVGIRAACWNLMDPRMEFVIQFAIRDKNGEKQHIQTRVIRYENKGAIHDFVPKEDILDDAEQLLPNNELRISCQILDLKSILEKSFKEINEILNFDLSSPLDGFEKLLSDGKFTDFKLLVKGKEFKVHREILAARSPVFDAIMNSDIGEAHVDDIEPHVMKELLNFVYTGKIKIENFYGEVLAAADKYQIDSLKIVCERKIFKKVSLDNVYDVIQLSERNNAATLKKIAISYFGEHLKELVARPNFTDSVESLPSSVKTEIIRYIGQMK